MTTKTQLSLDLSIAPSVSSRRWDPVTMSWDDLVRRAAAPEDSKDHKIKQQPMLV